MPKLSQEDYVIISAMALFGGGAAVMFVYHFPAILIAIATATAVSALIYRFLGGVAGASFTIGALKLAGTGAMLIGTAWWVDDRLTVELPTTPSGISSAIQDRNEQIQDLKTTVDQLQQEVKDASKTAADANQKRAIAERELTSERAKAPNKPTQDEVLAIIRMMKPGSPEATGLMAMEQNREGPWHVDQTETKVSIRGANYLGGRRVAACASLNYGKNTVVDITSLLQLNGKSLRASEPLKVTGWEQISAYDCSSDPTLQIQMSCQVLVDIFTEDAVKCDKQNQPLFQNGLANDFPATAVVN